MSFKEIYSYIPLKEIQANFPFVFDRIAPVSNIDTDCIVRGHFAVVEFHIYIIPLGEKIVKSLKFGENRGNKPPYALRGRYRLIAQFRRV